MGRHDPASGFGKPGKFVTHSTATGDPFCEWLMVLDRTPATEAFVASLPPAQDS